MPLVDYSLIRIFFLYLPFKIAEHVRGSAERNHRSGRRRQPPQRHGARQVAVRQGAVRRGGVERGAVRRRGARQRPIRQGGLDEIRQRENERQQRDEFDLRERIAELERQSAALIDENRRLRREIGRLNRAAERNQRQQQQLPLWVSAIGFFAIFQFSFNFFLIFHSLVSFTLHLHPTKSGLVLLVFSYTV